MVDLAKAVPLFSGSKGNSYYIGSGAEGVLIDAGRNCKQIEQAMALNGVDMHSVKAIFVTHEHIDHCCEKIPSGCVCQRRHAARP